MHIAKEFNQLNFIYGDIGHEYMNVSRMDIFHGMLNSHRYVSGKKDFKLKSVEKVSKKFPTNIKKVS